MPVIASSIDDIVELLASGSNYVVPHGGLTKANLTVGPASALRVDMRQHAGIVTYDPSEYLITARAGTLLSELTTVLAEHGQYLPFDPLHAADGSTLGGCVATGMSGPNRLMFGGLRDFVMEVELVDGLGHVVRGGGKVVKNAAGFDLPKLLVGSYGRIGILTELTLKVFPRPQASVTLSSGGITASECMAAAQKLQSLPLPISAIDFDIGGNASEACMHARFAGPPNSLTAVLKRAQAALGTIRRDVELLTLVDREDSRFWSERCRSLEETASGTGRVFVVHRAGGALALMNAFSGRHSLGQLKVSGGGTMAWLRVAWEAFAEVDRRLRDLGASGISLDASSPQSESNAVEFLGNQDWSVPARRIQTAMDPRGRFLPFATKHIGHEARIG